MTWNNDFRLAKITFHPDGQAAAVIEGLQDGGIEANPTTRRQVAAGSLYAKTASLENLSPTGEFNVLNIESGITALGLGGACITSTVNPGLVLEFDRRDCKGPASGNVHMKYTVGTGVIAPTTLSVDHRGDAVLGYQIFAAYDGTNNPVVIEHKTAPAVLSTASDKTFTMARADFNNAPLVEGKRNITIDFNPEVNSEGADSDTFDSVQSISSILSTIRISGVDPQWIKANTNPDVADAVINDITTGRDATGTDQLRIYLKDRNIPSASLGHILLECRGLVVPNTIISASPGAPAESSVEMALIQDGVNAPIVITTGVAIP